MTRRVTLRVSFNVEVSAEVSDVTSEPQAGRSLTILLIFIKQAEMVKGGAWGGMEGRQYAPHAE